MTRRRRILQAVGNVPVSPFLVAWFTVAFLYAENTVHVRLSDVTWPFVLATAVAASTTAFGWRLFTDRQRAAVFGVASSILLLSYGHAWIALAGASIAGVVVGRDLVLVPVWVLLVAALGLWTSRLRSTTELARIFRIIAIALLAFGLIRSGVGFASQRQRDLPDAVAAAITPAPDRETAERSVYYLIFDRYGGPSTIREHIKIDNDDFYRALRTRGFFTADESVSNYPKTVQSLASSLNMMYLDDVADELGRTSSNWVPLYDMMLDSRVAREFRARGLLHVHLGSPWDWLADDPSADVSIRAAGAPEFVHRYLETTMLRPVIKRAPDLFGRLDRRHEAHEATLFQFRKLQELAADPRPKFVFAHFMVPHDPYTFDRNGAWVPEDVEREGNWWELFGEQLRFTNEKILEAVDALLRVPADEAPVVILQADEGVYAHNNLYGLGRLSWRSASDDEIRLKFPILNAYHLPCGRDRLYPGITPVNTFRLVLTECFGAEYPLLPDEAYIFGDGTQPYLFRRVTDLVLPRSPSG